MIVVDSTVWIDHLRDTVTAEVDDLRDVIRNRTALLVVGDLVLCEVLQGLASEPQARRVEAALRGFLVEPMVGAGIAAQAAANARTWRGLGITVRKTIDMLIGTYCIEAGHRLLHSDRDFDPLERHLGLLVARSRWPAALA